MWVLGGKIDHRQLLASDRPEDGLNHWDKMITCESTM